MLWRIFQKHKVKDTGAMACIRHGACSGKSCPLWVEMTTTYKEKDGKEHNQVNGKCSFYWTPQLLTEIRNTINARNTN